MPADNFRVAVHSDDYFPNIGGVAAHVHQLTSALVECGVTAGVVTSKPSAESAALLKFHEEPGPPPVLRLPKQPPIFARYFGSGCRAAIRKFLSVGANDDRPLIFHSHWFQPWWIEDCDAFVFTNHTSMFLQDLASGRTEKWQRELKKSDAVIAPSTQLAEAAVAMGMPAERVTYIPNGVDAEQFKPDRQVRTAKRRQLDLADDVLVLLCARRIVPKNGVLDFAHSLRYLEQQVPAKDLDRLVILIAGNREARYDTYQDETLDAFQQTRVGRRAKLLGEVPNHEMPQLFAAADFSVLPSLKEATSIAGLEAMASGAPLVGTRVGGIPDLITDHEDGLLVDHGNPVALAAALAEMITNADLRHKLGTQAREKAVTQFSWQTIAKRTIEVYEQAVHSAGHNKRTS